MIIDITAELIIKLRTQEFYPDEMFSLLFVLKGLQSNEIDMLDAYDDFNSSKRAVISYQKLFRLGLIDKDKEGSQVFFKLTQKGIDFLKSLEPKNWIQDWIDLFPEKKPSGDVIRSEYVDVEPRMKAFIKKYKYSKDVIIAATKSYIINESGSNFQYIKRAMFFIDKRTEGSLLAIWCKAIAENKIKTGRLENGSRTEIIQTVN